MSEKISADRFARVPLADLTTPRSGLRCITKHWWAVTDDGCALFYKWSTRSGARGQSPQCNTDRRIVEHLIQGLPFNARPEYIPVAYASRRD